MFPYSHLYIYIHDWNSEDFDACFVQNDLVSRLFLLLLFFLWVFLYFSVWYVNADFETCDHVTWIMWLCDISFCDLMYISPLMPFPNWLMLCFVCLLNHVSLLEKYMSLFKQTMIHVALVLVLMHVYFSFSFFYGQNIVFFFLKQSLNISLCYIRFMYIIIRIPRTCV